MAWYCGTYSCGHEGRVNVIGPSKEREWKIDRAFSKMCPDCYKAQLEEENQKAIELAKEMELPDLQGSEKQVAWANTLRLKLIEKFDKFTEKDFDEVKGLFPEFDNLIYDDVLKIKDYIILNKTKASFYIDNRNESIRYFVETYKKQALEVNNETEKAMLDDIKTESTVFPEERITDVPVEITVLEDKITVSTEKNDDFKTIVKNLGYSWSGKSWDRKITKTNGPVSERSAELGNKLLNAGFPIVIFDEEIRQKAINGDFEPECKRWIFRRKNTDCFAINWTERDNDDLYKKARSLPGSKWSNGSVLVRVNHYQEVEEFAELYGFRFTEAAKELIDTYKKSLEKATVVKPAKVEETELKDGLQEILESGDDILDDLKD
ncbi:hypothetical protein ACW73O_11580 [Faecalibacterium prausnitzii]